jgi:hypothetical protein
MSKVANGTHNMWIPDFSSYYAGVGGNIHSETFQVDGYEWMLLVEKDGQHMYVSAELLTDPTIAGVRAYVYFMINDPSGEVEPAKEHLEYKFTRKVSCHRCNLTNTKYAEQNYLAHDGSLTIQ